ncbi:MAG: hypothetical protein Athens101428_557 [Candidatus Berkelbacteria bacterium Athens1014_28]|uniref:S23 ribosomal protein n=1 Tax=Candidatus Berkelbacteria bacterium Athens1014_28 TaxID=2017145 RepID=A0A554LLK2_9BACT|nr:MAG: hypothetical protein Athens101428_557 [Candidatus Berkelbacteria bacterium Athens1014_28]
MKSLSKFHPQTRQRTMDTADHMLRSTQSVVRNIEEGFSRATTKEYVTFLGFSKGSLEELLNDFEYCRRSNLGDEKISDQAIFLCKGEGKMLHNQIESLERKRFSDGTTSVNEKIANHWQKESQRKKEFDKYLREFMGDKGKKEEEN